MELELERALLQHIRSFGISEEHGVEKKKTLCNSGTQKVDLGTSEK